MALAVRRTAPVAMRAADWPASAADVAAALSDCVVLSARAEDDCAKRRVPAAAAARMSFAKPFSPANPFDSGRCSDRSASSAIVPPRLKLP